MDSSFVSVSSMLEKMFDKIAFTKLTQSPIEEDLTGALQKFGVEVINQYPIGAYFADIYIPDDKFVIECDGEEFHKNKERDFKRDQFMIDKGYKVMRFTGSQINKDSLGCAVKIISYLSKRYPKCEDYQEEQNRLAMEKIMLEESEDRDYLNI